MTDREIYQEIVRLQGNGEAAVLATVVASSGSSPRKPGAKLLLRADGSILGSVGGGRVEAETLVAARAALEQGEPKSLSFTLTEDHGFLCGGSMTLFVEPLGRAPQLIIFGAGHVGKALCRLASACGYRVTVVDERAACARGEELPGAASVLCAGVAEAFARLAVGPQSAIVIATPGHQSDFAAVRGALATAAGFIGLVGSARKKKVLLATLATEGHSPRVMARVTTPVGLDIGAETPEEIAISIVAQLVRQRRGERETHNDGNSAGRGRIAADGAVQAAPAPG
ncbi:MAG: dehydrogenase [Desulfuromonadales bacterium GWD2_61_12]|nr:MAG: dehydrogenase [Desulfuromonadales bacterium GWC2_61_20]OGR34240.1 MAG: dehydrogenase [Desulfuromonadales bacterium GWD2_61_12]HAD03547.1 dehydrogenase [Desulfuromonas sp.]HBT82802.1 dehydrogenase [Desulfuromonas sp.]